MVNINDVKHFGKYRVIAALGHGGTARVYLTVASGLAGWNKLMVVKVLRPELADETTVRLSFLQEARLAARLNHSNVIHTYEVSEDAGNHYIVMEFLDGQPLDVILKRVGAANISLPLRLHIVLEALEGLRYAHELRDFDGTPLGVVHRDISPQNIFVTYDGEVKVMDFGIAKVRGTATGTETGMFKGKVGYCAPEQVLGEKIDARADLFSMAVVLYELLAAKRFSSDDLLVAANDRIGGREVRVKEDATIPAQLAAICNQALEVEPQNRFASASEFSEALEQCAAEAGIRRASTKQLASLVTAAFAENRKQMQRKIDEQLRRADAADGASDSLPIVELALKTDSQAIGASVTKGVPNAPRWPSWALVVAGLIAVLVTLIVVLRTPPNRESDIASSTAIPTAPPPASSPPPEPTVRSSATARPPAREVERIRVEISASPDSAEVFLDGVQLPRNPFEAEVERDGKLHRVVAQAPGHKAESRVIAFDRDVKLDLTCRPERYAPRIPTKSKGNIDIDVEDPYKR